MIFRDRKLKLIEMEWIETGTLATKCNKARIDEKKKWYEQTNGHRKADSGNLFDSITNKTAINFDCPNTSTAAFSNATDYPRDCHWVSEWVSERDRRGEKEKRLPTNEVERINKNRISYAFAYTPKPCFAFNQRRFQLVYISNETLWASSMLHACWLRIPTYIIQCMDRMVCWYYNTTQRIQHTGDVHAFVRIINWLHISSSKAGYLNVYIEIIIMVLAFSIHLCMWIERGSLIIIEALFPFSLNTMKMPNEQLPFAAHWSIAEHRTTAAVNIKLLPISPLITNVNSLWMNYKRTAGRDRQIRMRKKHRRMANRQTEKRANLDRSNSCIWFLCTREMPSFLYLIVVALTISLSDFQYEIINIYLMCKWMFLWYSFFCFCSTNFHS